MEKGTTDSWQHQQSLHALASLALGNLTDCIPVVEGATFPILNTYKRFQSWQGLHGALQYQGAFRPFNAAVEAMGSDPTAGNDPFRVVKEAFIEGFPSDDILKKIISSPENGAQFMVEQVRKHPGQVTIYSAGALTNIALATKLDPHFASLAKELVVMGGYVDVNLLQATGSRLQADLSSDINLMMDPEAAKIAFTADWRKITFAGNVANQVLSSQEFLDEIQPVTNPYSNLIHSKYGTRFPFWDEIAAAIMVDPRLIVNSTNRK